MTALTLASFAEHNDLSMFSLFHADDASEDGRIVPLVQSYGFNTIVRTAERQGVSAVRTKLIARAARHSKWILVLENDILTLRPFPWDLFRFVRKNRSVYCLRLYGRFKDREKQVKCLETHKRMGHTPVQWAPLTGAPESAQIGVIHWSAQPCVTRTRELLEHHRTGAEPEFNTVRVKRNVMAHIGGDERTPGRFV